LEEIDEAFDHAFPHEALPEVLRVASVLTDSLNIHRLKVGVAAKDA
jgi:hypothetical protein